jgi:outer membrane autotransporter protein
VDYKVTSNFALGLAAGYTGTTADLTEHGRVWVNGGKLGLYGTFFQNTPPAPAAPTMSKDSSKEAPAPAPSPAGGFYADFAGFGGYNGYDTRRTGVEGEARGQTDGGEVDALFGAGYDFKKGGLTFGPTASFNYTYAGSDAFTEHNSLVPLNIHGGSAESERTAFGAKLSYECRCGHWLIKPELRVAWQHEFGNTTYALDSNFASGAGSTFTSVGPSLGRDSLLVGAGFAVQISDRISTYLYYDGELARKNYELNAVTGGIRIAF